MMYEEPKTVEEMLERYKAVRQRTNPAPRPFVNMRAIQPKLPAPDPWVPATNVDAPDPRVYVMFSDDGVPYFDAEPGSPVMGVTNTIAHSVCRDWNITLGDLRGARRQAHLVNARRQLVYTLAVHGIRKGPHKSLPQIAQTIQKDHTTVIWSLRKVTIELLEHEHIRARYRITLDAVKVNHKALCDTFECINIHCGDKHV